MKNSFLIISFILLNIFASNYIIAEELDINAKQVQINKDTEEISKYKLYKKSGTPVMDELRKRGMLK